MKRILLFAFLGFSTAVMAQEASKTTAPQSQPIRSVSGFGGVLFDVSPIRGQAAMSVGGGGAALFNNRFFFGGFGQSTAGNTPFSVNGANYETRINQGGLWLGYVSKLTQTLSVVSDVRLGWATVGLSRNGGAFYNSRGFIATPTVSLQVEAAPHITIRAGAGYGLANGINVPLSDGQGRATDRLTNADFGGFTGTFSVLFGVF
jgi:hypothetical protein